MHVVSLYAQQISIVIFVKLNGKTNQRYNENLNIKKIFVLTAHISTPCHH